MMVCAWVGNGPLEELGLRTSDSIIVVLKLEFALLEAFVDAGKVLVPVARTQGVI